MITNGEPTRLERACGPKARWDGSDSEVRVLLVGPPTDLGDEVADLARAAGCSVHQSWHAADALFLLGKAYEAEKPIDVVIADEALSGIDPPLLAVLVREDERFSSVCLILLERSSDVASGRSAAWGYDGRIGPVVDVASLPDMIKNLLAGFLSPPDDAECGAEKAWASRGDGPSILIVEDNAVNMEVVYEMIRRIGHSCDCAVNGHEAVQAVKRFPYDLVLMDCQLPGMDGYEATSRIRRWETTSGRRRVPIVAVTAHAMTGDRERCLAAGMDDYMTKPVDLRGLEATISKWLTADIASRQDPERI